MSLYVLSYMSIYICLYIYGYMWIHVDTCGYMGIYGDIYIDRIYIALYVP